MLHLTVLRNEENEAVYNISTGNESRPTTYKPFFHPIPVSSFSSNFLVSSFGYFRYASAGLIEFPSNAIAPSTAFCRWTGAVVSNIKFTERGKVNLLYESFRSLYVGTLFS